MNEITSQIEALKSELSAATESHAIVLNEKTTLQNDIQILENDKNQLSIQLKEIQGHHESLQASILENEKQKQGLQTSLSEYEIKIAQNSEQINLLQAQIESLKQVETQLQNLKSENEQLQQQATSYTELLKKREGELTNQQEKEQQLLHQKEEEIKSIQTKYQESIKKRDVKLNNMESEIQELKKALESATSEKNLLNTTIEQQKKTFEDKLDDINTRHQEEKKNQEKLAASLTETLNEKNTLVEKLKSEKNALVEERSQLKAKEELLQTTIERYRAETEVESNNNKKKGVKRDSQDDTAPTSSSTMDPPKKKVKNDTPAKKEFKVIFSGFNDKIAKYTNAFKKTLEDYVKELGGVIVDDVDMGATHVVAPPGVRTIKVLQAAVAHIWIMNPEWLEECKKHSKLVDESSFGKLREEELFKGKNVGFTDAFKKECDNSKYKAQKRMTNAKTLVEGGSGAVTEMEEAELILVSAEESLSANGKTKRVFTWEGFLDYIFPKN
ncbi:predicted protein [Naegleria gruberi]|uniref:Predicted protein n=1 Tax=Naegleria gruberi TaxID=5762 RepID=D2V7J3_NAEGR|nr:uncharacterized protein NAEGRDRAFT_78906 [Naegleria gruberi]EFC47261.1 predicted protein [Naegleria gruberi]|eukprot:XP_002680005.1 predicted protein [Naegleria gruberi strain NEG-M]